MSTDQAHRHIWTGASPRSVRCALMGCTGAPSRQDNERLATEVARAQAMRTEIDYATPALNLRLRAEFIAGAEEDS